MKKLSKYFLIVMLLFLIVGCDRKVETYESRDVAVESVFDDLDIKSKYGEVESLFSDADYYEENIEGLDTISNYNDEIDNLEGEYIEDDGYLRIMLASDLLRLRAEANRDSFTIRLLQPGEEVVVLEDGVGEDGTFSRVSSGEDEGYVATEYLVELGTMPVYVPPTP